MIAAALEPEPCLAPKSAHRQTDLPGLEYARNGFRV